MFKLLATLLIIISLFKVSFAFASGCNTLFSDVESSTEQFKQIREVFDKIYFDNELVEKIDYIKEHTSNSKSSRIVASRNYSELLKPLYDLLYDKNVQDLTPYLLKAGLGNLTLDLLDPSSKEVNARRILHENFAIINIRLATEAVNSHPASGDGSVISLNPNLTIGNRELVSARRKIYGLIDSYRFENQISKDTKRLRIDILFDSDPRLASLSSDHRVRLVNRMLRSFEDGERFMGSELLTYYYLKHY